MRIYFQELGFTLLELVMVILISAVIATGTVVFVGQNQEATRYEETRKRMEALKLAILGDDAMDTDGHKVHFGYHGDMGRLPASLGELSTIGTQTAWAYDATNGLGIGWRGPYVNKELTGINDLDKDAWNRAYIYNTSGTATITSYAADGASGGIVYNQDLDVAIPLTSRVATVRGILQDGDLRRTGVTVRIRHPSNGALSETTASTDAQGGFSVASIPLGIRAIAVTSTPTLGPNRFIVDAKDVTIPPTTLDYGGTSSVSYVASSASVATNVVDFIVTSTYPATLTLRHLTASWSKLAYLSNINFVTAGVSHATPRLHSGTRYDAATGTALTINAGATVTLRLTFVDSLDGTGTPSMSDVKFNLTFEWSGVAKHDAINFAT